MTHDFIFVPHLLNFARAINQVILVKLWIATSANFYLCFSLKEMLKRPLQKHIMVLYCEICFRTCCSVNI